jgi:uncharacterized protein
MKLEQSFDVKAPIDRVWSALVDVEHVAPCLPGAQVTGRNDDGSYNGSFSVKIGPTVAAYSGKLEMRDVDEQSHTATMYANGTDKRGQGGAKATIVSRLQAVDGVTHVEVDTDYTITGRLARFGRGGMIEDISHRLLKEFAARLQASLEEGAEVAGSAAPAAEPPPVTAAESAERATPDALKPGTSAAPVAVEPLDAGSLVASITWEHLRRNPGPPLAIAAMLMLLLIRRRRRSRSAS